MIGGIYPGGSYPGGFPSFEDTDVITPPAEVPAIIWDATGTHRYESGIDRGVLYLMDGRVVPWNGLTSIDETVNRESTSVYYDGMKINTHISLGDYTATLKAFTYPDEFEELMGFGELFSGVLLDNQPVGSFGLSYRTLIGDDLGGIDGYKIHILWNVVVLPKDRTYESLAADPNLIEFEWDISAVQEEVDGYSPTSHFIIDSTKIGADILAGIETVLYGDPSTTPSLPSMTDFVALLYTLGTTFGTTIISIVDNGDGTWTATTEAGHDELITVFDDGSFEILEANVDFEDDTFDISDSVVE